MNSPPLTVEDIYIAKAWLKDPDPTNIEARATVDRALEVLRILLGKDLTRKNLVTYLRMHMGIIPKSEQLPKDPPANQRPGAAIFRR